MDMHESEVGAWRGGLLWDVNTHSSPTDVVTGAGPVERPGAQARQQAGDHLACDDVPRLGVPEERGDVDEDAVEERRD